MATTRTTRMSPLPWVSAPSRPKPILSPTPRFLSPSPLFFIPNRSSCSLLSLLSFSSRSSRNNNGPETECPVPHINEYHSLSTSFPFLWATGDMTGASFLLLPGLPVAWFGSAGAQAEPAKRLQWALCCHARCR